MPLPAELTAAAEAEWLDPWTTGPTAGQRSAPPAGFHARDDFPDPRVPTTPARLSRSCWNNDRPVGQSESR